MSILAERVFIKCRVVYLPVVDETQNTGHLSGCSPMQVPILHSDTAFNLLYNNNVSHELMATIPLTLAPYPQGLLTGNTGNILGFKV